MALFGELLRQWRLSSGLTQDELADAARLSTRAISDLERGINRTARKETARLLAEALRLEGADREAFMAAARGRVPLRGLAAASITLPRDISSFTGRETELAQVSAATEATSAGLCVIGGMAGVGKTALAVHVAHLLAPRFTDGQVFLPLHAHTPGQRPTDAADALGSLLRITGIPPDQIPVGLEARTWLWRDHIVGKKLLLLLDDAVDSEQVRPLLPGTAGSLVLVTSRRRLTALDDAASVSLDALPADEATALLIRLASRGGLDPSDPAVGEIGSLCGYLPLALGMLGRRLHHHPAWTPADLAAELRTARDRLALLHTEDLSVAAAFDLSYQDLTGDQQRLLRRLGSHPGTDVDAYAAAALDGIALDAARRGLEDLYDHYLLIEPAAGRYRMHDLIREYAHDLVAGEHAAEQAAVTGRVLDYYLHTARSADRQLGRRVPTVTVTPPAHVPEFADRAAALTWMEAERLNLHASAQYAETCGRHGHAVAIPAAMHEFLRGQGHWHQALDLDQLAIEAARHGGGQLAEARALADLADIQYLTDNYPAATASLARALELYRSLGHRIGEANSLTQLGAVQHAAGEEDAASATLTEALKLYRELGNRQGEANALSHLGAAREAADDLTAAAANLARALTLYRDLGDRIGEAGALTDTGIVQHLLGQDEAAATSLMRALELYESLGDRLGEARACNSMGELALASGDSARARSEHEQALKIATNIDALREQARALEGLGHCHLHDQQPDQATTQLRAALTIYRQIRSPRERRLEELLRSCGSESET